MKLTEAPLKMTGGDCHDTLVLFSAPGPFPLPTPASSGPTGMLTGAVAWNMDRHPTHAKRGHNRKRRRRKGRRKNSHMRREKDISFSSFSFKPGFSSLGTIRKGQYLCCPCLTVITQSCLPSLKKDCKIWERS